MTCNASQRRLPRRTHFVCSGDVGDCNFRSMNASHLAMGKGSFTDQSQGLRHIARFRRTGSVGHSDFLRCNVIDRITGVKIQRQEENKTTTRRGACCARCGQEQASRSDSLNVSAEYCLAEHPSLSHATGRRAWPTAVGNLHLVRSTYRPGLKSHLCASKRDSRRFSKSEIPRKGSQHQ